MLKNYLLFFIILGSTAYSQYITKNNILQNSNSYQLSSCKDIKCVQQTEEKVQNYNYTTLYQNNYYVTYVVNIKKQALKQIKQGLKPYFPDMILKKQSLFTKKTDHPQSKSNSILQKNSLITIDKSTFLTKYKQALKYFKEKNYEKAYEELNQLFTQKPNNLNINFYLGRSAYETTRYHESIIAYERFLFEEPDNSRVKLEMARAFFMAGTIKESKRLFTEVKNDPKIPDSTLKIVNFYLKSIDNKTDKHSVNGIIMLGILKDSNINSRSNHDVFNNVYLPSSNIYLDLTNTTEDASNWYNQEIALINHKYKLADNKSIKQDFLIYKKDSFDSTYDTTKVTLLSYTPALSVKYNEKLTIDYALYTDYLKYAGKSKLKTYALLPKFTYRHNRANNFTGYFKYQKKRDQQDSTQDATYTEANTNLVHTYNKKMSLTSSITISDETAKDSSQTGIDYRSIKSSLSFNYIYKPTLFFTPSVTYTRTEYDDIDTNYLVKKTNKQIKFALSTTYVYSPKWIVQGTADFTNQHSNIAPNEYDKYTFGLNLIRPF